MPKGIYKNPIERAKKIGNALRGKKKPLRSEEHKRKISEANKGRKHTEETKKKMSEMLKGNKNPRWKGGKPKCIDCGKRLADYQSKRCLRCRGLNQCQEKHFNWKGGISKNSHSNDEPKYKQWRSDIFQRDNWTCQTCGLKGKKLVAHHIKSWAKFPELRYEIENGITLCEECHKLTDNYCGKK